MKIVQCRLGDVDCNGIIDLADAVICLKSACGISTSSIALMADVNFDTRIGVEEGVYIIQMVAQQR